MNRRKDKNRKNNRNNKLPRMAGADRATSAILAGQQLHRADIMPLPTQYLHHDVGAVELLPGKYCARGTVGPCHPR